MQTRRLFVWASDITIQATCRPLRQAASRQQRSVAVWIVCCLALPFCGAAEHFNLEHADRVVNLADPQITPDGKSVVISATRANFRDNVYESQLVRVDVATKAQTVLTSRNARQHQLSPDGRSLAFLSLVEGRTQIFIVSANGGPARQVSRAATGVSQYAWRPDGQAIAYVSEDEQPKKEGDERHNLSFVADVGYTYSRSTRPSHLWIVASGGGEARRLTSGEWSVGPGNYRGPADRPSWSTDGKRIFFSHYPGPGDRVLGAGTLRVLDLESGEVTLLHQKVRSNQFFGISPDGRYVLYRQGGSLWISLVAGGQERNISNGPAGVVTEPRWAPDGTSVLFRGLRGPKSGLWIQPLDGPARRLDLGGLTRQTSFHRGPNGSLAVVGTEANHPAELYFLKSLDSSPERLTDFNAPIRALELGRQEPLQWLSPDKFEMNGVLTYPPDYQPGTAYPLVALIHGGPFDSSLLGFDVRSQWLASHGWVVFEPNYRGSNNLPGASWAAPVGIRREGPAKDVMSCIDLLIAKGIADPSRVAVSGWSYGAAVSIALLEQYPERWRAAVVGAAPVDGLQQHALTFFGPGGPNSPFTSPGRAQDTWDRSLISRAFQIKTPTLVLGNQRDHIVPITQAYYLYHALGDNGVEAKLVVYPIDGHIAEDPVHQRDVNRRWAEWIKEHMKPTQ